jgi:hypothetical protein
VVVYVYETWSLTLRDERGLRVFENRVLRRIYGPEMDEMVGGWRKVHDEERHNVYSFPDIIRTIKRRTRWTGNVARIRETRKCIRGFDGKARRKDMTKNT